MKKAFITIFFLALFSCSKETKQNELELSATINRDNSKTPFKAIMRTVHGKLIMEFDMLKAPLANSRVKTLIENGHYNGQDVFEVKNENYLAIGNKNEESEVRIKDEFNNLKIQKNIIGILKTNGLKDSAKSNLIIITHNQESYDLEFTPIGKVISGEKTYSKFQKGDKIISFDLIMD